MVVIFSVIFLIAIFVTLIYDIRYTMVYYLNLFVLLKLQQC